MHPDADATPNARRRVRPPFSYYGGKTRLAPRLAALLPTHRHYVEAFGGSLAVLLAKPPAPFETVNDLDSDLMTFWRVLRDRPLELGRVCALTPHSRAEFAAAHDLDVADELERARRVWIRLSQGRVGHLHGTGWRHFLDPDATNLSMSAYLAGYVRRMERVAQRLAQVSLENRDGLEVVDRYGRYDGVLIYADPPYLGTTRGWGNQYPHEMRAEDDHERLAAALRTCRAAVVLSGYPSPLYDELYGGWNRVDLRGMTSRGGARTEVVWSNRPLPPCEARPVPAQRAEQP